MKQIENHIQETANAKRLYSAAKESQMNAEPTLSPEASRRLLVMTTLWQRMREIFGNVWTLNYGDANQGSIETWTAGLAKYSENQIRMGVELCRNWDGSFPPNLGQFAKLCLTKSHGQKPDQKQIAPVRTDSVRQAEILRQTNIRADQCRETKDESMRKLGLNARWST